MVAVCLPTCFAFLLSSIEQMSLSQLNYVGLTLWWPDLSALPSSCKVVPDLRPLFSAKEIQLMHRAPVVGIVVLDGHGAPLPEPLEVAHDLARAPDMQGSHHLLVVSEEQFKVRLGALGLQWVIKMS